MGDTDGDAFGLPLAASLVALLGPLAALAWLSGLPFLLPSLGPSAYVLVARERPYRSVARETVVGQFAGAVVAYAAVRALVGPLASVTLLPHTAAGLRQVAAVLVAVVAATVAMRALDAVHAPAYATVLIFTLGVPPRARDLPVFCSAVVALVVLGAALARVRRARGR